METIKLTQYSKGSGCGCKIAPGVLEKILASNESSNLFPQLLVGNRERDDAAVYDYGDGTALISTTDFFMPIVDDAFDFGRIASANAISDVYAMGGKPLMAVAILGWPVEKLSPELAAEVLKGSRLICDQAGIPLAGGHSIDSPEPIFGLAVTGKLQISQLKRNKGAKAGDLLFLTKEIGTGIMGTAHKRGILDESHKLNWINSMCQLNQVGAALGSLNQVHAMTDVTGFGLIGHLIEMCHSSEVSAELYHKEVPLLPGLEVYTNQFCFPDNTTRNLNAYKAEVSGLDGLEFISLCDPQTSGGLLVSVSEDGVNEYIDLLKQYAIDEKFHQPIGRIIKKSEQVIYVK